jgi:saccharopine dehydrogenase (NAD+, L-lysine-forming)
LEREIPFSDRTRSGVAIPWGDVSTAYYSTGIPNVTVYQTGLGDRLRQVGRFAFLLRRRPVRRLLQWWVGRTVTGPTDEQRATGRMRVWAQAREATGRTATVELSCPDGYTFTADAAVTAVTAMLGPSETEQRTGFLTPSLAFGADFVDRLEGVRSEGTS